MGDIGFIETQSHGPNKTFKFGRFPGKRIADETYFGDHSFPWIFPENPDKRDAWIKAASKDDWNPPDFSSLCSLHFRDDCFNDSNELYEHALPTIFFNDFKSHIRGIVRDFDLQCGFSEEDDNGEESADEIEEIETQIDFSDPKLSSDVDDDDVSIVECEEIMEYDDDDDDGARIENITISESNENINAKVTESIHTSPIRSISSSPKPAPPLELSPKPTSPSELSPKPTPLSEPSLKPPSTPISLTKLMIASKPGSTSLAAPKTATVSKPEPAPQPVISSAPKPAKFFPTKPAILSKPKLTKQIPATKSTPISKPETPELKSTSTSVPRSAPVSKPQSAGSNSQIIKNLQVTPTLRKIAQDRVPVDDTKSAPNTTTKTPFTNKVTNQSANNEDDNDDIICLDDIETPNKTVASNSLTKKPTTVQSSTSSTAAKSLESTKHLFDLLKPASLNPHLIDQPASRNLILQLLNVVKMANVPNENKDISNLPSTYIITTKIDEKDDTEQRIEVMESAKVIQTITCLLANYKAGVFLKPNNVNLICGSPAIFLMKYVSVKNCDPEMNSLYIITNENLLPNLFQHRVKDRMMNRQKKEAVTKPPVTSSAQNSQLKSNNQSVERVKSSDTQLALQNNAKSSLKNSSSTPSTTKPNSPASSSTFTTEPLTQPAKSTPRMLGTSTSTSTPSTNRTSVTSRFASPVANVPRSVSTASKHQTSVAPVARVIPSSFTSPSTSKSPASTSMATSAFSKPRPSTSLASSVIPETSFSAIFETEPVPSTSSFIDTPRPSDKSRPSISSVVKDFFASSGFPSSLDESPTIGFDSNTDDLMFTFQPILAETFNTQLTRSPRSVSPCSPIPSTSKGTGESLKRKWPREYDVSDDDDDDDDDADDDNIIVLNSLGNEFDRKEYAYEQQKEIEILEHSILQREREIDNLKKKFQILKKRLDDVSNPYDNKTDDQLVENILSKYIDPDGVQFFIGQMKVAGKTYTQFRWSEEDKLFALSLLYKNPVEYNILFQKYTLPSDKTLNKFVTRIKKAEMGDARDGG